MTDRELMQQALEVLENNLQVMKDDWQQIDQEWGPSQGGLQAAIDGTLTGYEYFKDTISTITALRERLAQPEMEPCAGRNCGSTNPNLHSAECFEDYEQATGMNQWVGLTADEIWKCNKAKSGSAVEFHICVEHQNVLDFAESIEAKLREKNHG